MLALVLVDLSCGGSGGGLLIRGDAGCCFHADRSSCLDAGCW